VRRLVVTSSGAAYGYHADNPVPLREGDALRGNPEFPYADHKRQVEEMLAGARQDHPQLEQVVLRVGTVLGAGTDNQITALFHKPRLLAIRGSDSPFVFIWSRDLARILRRAATDGPPGIYNVAGDGALSVDDIARRLHKPVLRLPAGALRAALAVARPLGLSRYGPEQVRFLQYRPVLDNTALKARFGYRPEKTSAEVFELWMRDAGL
jgi:UDP-glucose 4-epimerase